MVSQETIPWEVDCGVEQRTFFMDDGEEAKNLETIEELCRSFTRWGLHRNDVVVAVGGGVVTDVAGFAAAVYHRGVRVVHVPTSLLGQVDAAIGGKTGVNLREGKNLVGAFWQPSAVLCDTETLSTLPPREYRSGLGEMAKYAFLGVDGLRDLSLEDAVAGCVACKAAVVATDERESGFGPAGPAQLRPHPRPRPGDHRALRPAARGGGCHRPGLRGPTGPSPGPHRRRTGGRARGGGRRVRPAATTAIGAGSGGASDRDGPGQEGHRPGPGVRARRPGRAGGGGCARECGHGHSRRGPAVTALDDTGTATVLLLSGPNLNMLGEREPNIYGTFTLADHVATASASAGRFGLVVEHHQSQHEGDLVELIQGARGRAAAIVINPGALTHYAWSLHDALAAFDGPVIELHLSNPDSREAWRRTSVVAPVATGSISGLGGVGYRLAIEAVAELLGRSES